MENLFGGWDVGSTWVAGPELITDGPVASNHVNLQKHRYFPWFKGHYGVHAEVNRTKGKKGRKGVGNGDRNRESRPAGT